MISNIYFYYYSLYLNADGHTVREDKNRNRHFNMTLSVRNDVHVLFMLHNLRYVLKYLLYHYKPLGHCALCAADNQFVIK